MAYLTRDVVIAGAYTKDLGSGGLETPLLIEERGFFEAIDLGDGYMWFGAGGALLVAGVLLISAGFALRRRQPSQVWQIVLPGALAIACFTLATVKDGAHIEVVTNDGWTSYGPLSDDNLRLIDLWEPSDKYMWFGGGVALLVVTLASAAVWWHGRAGRLRPWPRR